jgi:TonB family protein
MATAIATYRIYDLPWATGAEQEGRFKRLLGGTVAAVLVVALTLSLLPIAERDASDVREVPPRLARLLTEREPPPPPVVVQPEPEPEPEEIDEPAPEPEPEPIVEEREEPTPIPEPEPEPEEVVQPEPEPVDTTQLARERASVAGLLPFAAQLATLRDSDTADRLEQADSVGMAGASAPVIERSLITSSAGTSSAGINLGALSRNTGGAGLAGRATTEVVSPVVATTATGGGEVTRSGTSDKGSRSREEIERVFDRNKGAIYALYNRALRTNPGLSGKVVLRLTISPQGVVTACEIVSSELGDADLEQKLVQRILLFQFDSKDVAPITTTKPIDFFPA